MYKTILVPFDGSPPSLHGLRDAISLAGDQKAHLIVLNVAEDYRLLAADGLDGGLYTEETIALLKADSQQLVDYAVKLAREEGVDAEGISIESFSDRSAEVIVKQAALAKADLIVMGTHGRRGLGRVVMGSDAEMVVRTSEVPVLLVRGAQGEVKRRAAAVQGKAPEAGSPTSAAAA